MTIQVITVHPSVTVVSYGGRQFEIPTEAFSTAPQVGQRWELSVHHIPTSADQVAKLNDYLTTS